MSAPAPASAPTPVRIIDGHVNLASEFATPQRFIDEQIDNAHHRLVAMGQEVRRDRLANRISAIYQDHDGDRLVAEMDAAGVAEAVLIVPDFTYVAACRLTPPELAELHHRVCERHPGRFRVLWGVDPRAGSDGIELFQRCLDEYGFAGLKLYPLNGYSPSDRRLYPYFEICAQRRLPVLSHTGPGWQALDFNYGQPLLIDQAARDFPGVNFVLGHGGVTHVEEASYLCVHRPNVYLDIGGFQAVLSPDGWAAHLNRLFHLGINHKIVFGTSWPAFRLSASLAGLVGEFRDTSTVFAGIKPSARRLILGGNVLRLHQTTPMPVGAGGSTT